MTKLIPGILLSSLIAFTGIFLSDFIGIEILNFEKSPISSIMLSIILGICVANTISFGSSFSSGIDFCCKYILRLGIIFLGIRIGLSDIFDIGLTGLPVVILCISLTLIIVHMMSKLLNVSAKLSTLIAVGTSICGATAIVATGPVINAKKEEITYAVANITIFGIFAMLVYPILAHYIFNANSQSVGLFLGTSIHETAQVAGAGLIYSQQYNSPGALDIATVTKLVRNLSMIIVIPLMGYLFLQSSSDNGIKNKPSFFKLFPLFIIGFIFFGILRTLGDYGIAHHEKAFFYFEEDKWIIVINFIKSMAEILLGIAMSAVGLSTKFSSLRDLGIKPFYVGFIAATSVGAISFVGINLVNLI